jgi:hypothetical protein
MMDPISLKKDILRRVNTLSYELQCKLLEYIDFLTIKQVIKMHGIK